MAVSRLDRQRAWATWLLLWCWPVAGWPDFDAGLAAYNRGDYVAAFREFKVSAEQGDALAQFNLGVMYDSGQGVPQDYAEAVRWFRKAAEQGNASARYNLALMYDNGQGVPQDYIKAYAWFNVAASVGDKDARRARDIVAEVMTPSQLEEGQKLARELFEKYPPKPELAPGKKASRSSLVRSIQQKLLALGYSPGPADGIMGPKTRGAIRRFQQDHGLPVTWKASEALLRVLEAVER